MKRKNNNHLTAMRAYRLSPTLAHSLYTTANKLDLTESAFVRMALDRIRQNWDYTARIPLPIFGLKVNELMVDRYTIEDFWLILDLLSKEVQTIPITTKMLTGTITGTKSSHKASGNKKGLDENT